MKAAAIGLCCLLGSSAAFAAEPAPAPRVLTFEALLLEISRNSPALNAARAQVAVTDAEVYKSYTGWKPRLDAIGTVTLNSVESELDLSAQNEQIFGGIEMAVNQAIGDFTGTPGMVVLERPPAGEPVVIQPRIQLGGILRATQTLFNIAVLRAPGVAKAARRAAMSNVEALEDELLFQGATVFATLGGLTELEKAAARAVSIAQKRIEDTKAQLEAGTATQLALTRAETDRAVAEGQRIALQAQRKKLLASLNILINAEGPVDVESAPLARFAPATQPDLEARSSVVAKQQQLDAADKSVGLFDAGWLPTLQLDGQLRWSNVAGFAGNNLIASASLNLVIPLYDGGGRYADTDVAQARVIAARRALELERAQARAFWEEAQADLSSAQAELEQSEAQLAFANAAVEQAEKLSEAGLGTSLDLTDADGRRFQADRQVARKRLDLALSRLRLYYAGGGRLTPKQ